MTTLNRSEFLSQFANKCIDVKDLESDSSVADGIKSKLASVDRNGDGKVAGSDELNNLFTQLDNYDRNGDSNSVRTMAGSTKTPVGRALSAASRHASALEPNLAVGGAPSDSSTLGRALGAAGKAQALSRGTTGRCYSAVADAVDGVVGRFLWGPSAYMAADQLAGHPNFREISVGPEKLPGLPPGAVVVWGKTARSPHGHISISLGNGQEASDHIDSQRTQLRGYTNARVFLPKG